MARKKKQEILEEQAISDTLTIEDVKQFIADSKKCSREDWLNIADRSWREIKKRNNKNKLVGGSDLDRTKRYAKFPLWWSCLQVRLPIVFARLAIPVLKDTQGDDPLGRTACVLGERLTRGILKTFDCFSEFEACAKDFLVTNFAYARVFFRQNECYEDEKLRVQEVMPQPQQPMMDEMGQPVQMPEPQPIYIAADGTQVDPAQVLQDDLGLYILTGQQVIVDNQEVYLEACLYNTLYIDPHVTKWNQVSRLAYEMPYSYRDFIKKFGKEAFEKLEVGEAENHRCKGVPIIVYEYHDKYLKEVRWFAENSEDFFQPLEISKLNEEGKIDNSDLFGLTGFFPNAEPLIINQSTDEYWPTPEYFQVQDLIEDINNIVNRMMLLTKAIRVRFLFDSSILELKQLTSETGEAGGIGVPNLENALMNANGKLTNLVAYFPVAEMIQGLQNMYQAFDLSLNRFYQITGISDLIRGQTDNAQQKTFGERQMEGKFALNRIEPYQRKMQEWIKDNYQLLMELALKLFTNETLDEYITPQTLDPEDKQRYAPALELLKSNKRNRFRVDFETDSTISINQQWKKQQAVELANTLTKAMESVANVAQTQPELAGTELAVLKHLIGEFTDGKLFVDEIQDSIQQVIDKVSQPKPEEPNPDMMKIELEHKKLELEGQRLQATNQLEQMKIQANQQLEIAKLQQQERFSTIESQLGQYKLQSEQQLEQIKVQADAEKVRAELQKDYQKISADISLAQQELALKRDELLVELRKVADKKEVDQLALIIDQRIAGFEQQLEKARLELDATNQALDLKERYITEARLQSDHKFDQNTKQLEAIEKMLDVAIKKKELDAPTEVKEPKAEAPKKPRKKTSKVVRDKNGDIERIIHEED